MSTTERQRQIAVLIAQGQYNKQIAVALGITEHAVSYHIRCGMRDYKALTRSQFAFAVLLPELRERVGDKLS